MSSGDVLDELAAEFVSLRRQEARVLAKIAEADRDGAAIPFGTVSKLVADVGRCGPAEARRLAERARVLHERVGLSGTPIPATLPNTARAYAHGAIGSEHVDKIRGLAEELPAEVVAGQAWPIAEQALADHAREVGPRGLTRPAREFAARLDPDGQQPNERDLAQPHRALRLTKRHTRYDLSGSIDLETGMKLQALLDTFGKPHSSTESGGQPDWRTTAERHGDALAETIQLAAVSKQLPENGGEPFTILLTAPETTLQGNFDQHGNSRADRETGPTCTGPACTGDPVQAAGTTMAGTRIPAAQLRRIACDATIITKHGQRKRTAPPALRRALIARDQGCAHPDCDAPPSRTQAHHIQHYANNGPTSLENMVLLCGHHHERHARRAWSDMRNLLEETLG